MATTFTQNILLQKPGTADRNWHVPLNANHDLLDSVSSIGNLFVTPTEIPSSSLNIRVSGGTYVEGDGTAGMFPGVDSVTLPPSSAVCVWLNTAGALVVSSSYPVSTHVRLAQVVTSPSSVQSVVDERVCVHATGSPLGFVLKSGDTISGPLLISSSTGPTLAVDPTASSLGFFGVQAVTQAVAIAPIVDNTSGTPSNSVADVGTSFNQNVIDNNFATLAAKINALSAVLRRYGLISS
jgi:hypothetical protein